MLVGAAWSRRGVLRFPRPRLLHLDAGGLHRVVPLGPVGLDHAAQFFRGADVGGHDKPVHDLKDLLVLQGFHHFRMHPPGDRRGRSRRRQQAEKSLDHVVARTIS